MTHLSPHTDQTSYSDLPATHDELGFAPSAAALAAIVQGAERADTPLAVGIYGPWGSGKTSLMQMIRARLDDSRCTAVWFDAWRYAQQEALWRALLLSVAEALRAHVAATPSLAETRAEIDARFDDLAASLYRSVDREESGAIEFQWDKAGKLVAGTIIRAGFSYLPIIGRIADAAARAGEKAGEADYAEQIFGLFQRERTRIYREQVRSLEQFHQGLRGLVKELVTDFDRRLVIFIDDLDRCLPEQALGVMEAIKVFLDIEGCVFVLGVDRAIIEHGIQVRYKELALSATGATFPLAERDYLEKIIQVPFTLPPLAPAAIGAFLNRRLPAVEGLDHAEHDQVASLMTAGLLRNPRKVKRSFNIFRLHLALDRAHGRQTPAGLIAKVTVIQSSFAGLYERIAHEPTLLRQIEHIVRGTPGASAVSQGLRDELGRCDQRLRDLLYLGPFFSECSDQELRDLVYQSMRIGEADGIPHPGAA